MAERTSTVEFPAQVVCDCGRQADLIRQGHYLDMFTAVWGDLSHEATYRCRRRVFPHTFTITSPR